MLRRLTKIVELLGVNSVPVLGVFAGEWSSATALSVYWAENLIASLLIAVRLYLHRRWNSVADAASPGAPAVKAPGPFLGTAIPFTLAHGVILAAVFAAVVKAAPDLAHLRQAVFALLVVQGLAFGVDLWTLERWPAYRVNERADYLLGRVVLVHLSIIAGMVLAAWLDRPGAFFAFFVGCKVLSDLTQFLPRIDTAPGSAPPRWLAAVMRKLPSKDGRTFEQHWADTHGAGRSAATPPASPAARRERPEPGRTRRR